MLRDCSLFAASGGMKTQQNKGKSGKESFPETQLCNAGQTAQGCSSQLSVTE